MEKLKMKEARKKAGFKTQSEVAERVGKTTATISNYETGKTSPTYPVARMLAELYGMSVDEIDFCAGNCSVKSNKER